ncbi:MAG: acetyl-coenzyme A synthetase N-terminal domain-containing protein, partial [Dehalococcoidia bacterium]
MVSTSLPSESIYWPFKKYLDMYNQSIQDPERFWAEEARKLDWFKTWDTV